MQKTAILTISLALSLAFGAQVTGETEEPTPGIPVDTPDGIVILDDHEPRFECIEQSTLDQILGGSVPPTNSCEHGIYVRTDGDHGFSHGFSGLPYQDNEWTGTMQSWLKWAGQNRGFQCTFDEGELVEDSCFGLGGTFPSVGERFIQECRAYDPHGLELEVALTEFGCMVRGNVALD